jgi:bifunctional oligoribonuclease and PAP phosphatase NrnA
MKNLAELESILSVPKNIVITTHQNPDADAFGSSLGLYHYLQKKGHQVTVVSGTYYTNFLKWMPGCSSILIYEKEANAVQDILQKSDILFCLDFNIYTRTASLAAELKNYTGIKVIIDHHLFPDEAYFDYGVSIPEKSSTCEMVFDYIVQNKDINLIDKNIAECLYAGVMTDTGGFRYYNTSADTHRMTAMLLEKGAVPNQIAENIFDNYEEKRLRLLGHLFSNRLEIIKEKNTALIYISAEDAATFSVGQGDAEGIVNYPLSLANVKFSVLMTEKENEIRISFRSKGEVNVNEFARKYFNGGGHHNAAGGKSNDNLQQTIEAFHVALHKFF